MFVGTGSEASVLSDWTIAEAVSAISRGVRMRVLSREDARTALAGIDGWAASAAERIEVASADIRAAERMLRSLDTTLRTPDALHVVIAQRIGAPLLTFDQVMAREARKLGLTVIEI
ncbi:MAG: hypothetical protein ABS78_05860 [Phenylobacterium sp. SCN 70-31]|nr:MAG: hypothetical protein ABS78_05860 [Phenylobacterium sp. SCN 70-31]